MGTPEVMEHVIYRNIMQHLEHNNILHSKQHGFRKNHSCETQLPLTVEDLAKNLDEGSEVDLQIFDFSKAFDKVPHQRLLSKLNYYGIRGKTLAWINSWLTESVLGWIVKVLVWLGSFQLGVPQGTVLAPPMFLLFMGDPKTLTPGPWTPIRTGSTDYYTDRSTDYPDGPPPRTPPKTTWK